MFLCYVLHLFVVILSLFCTSTSFEAFVQYFIGIYIFCKLYIEISLFLQAPRSHPGV